MSRERAHRIYDLVGPRVATARAALGRPVTYTEKLLLSHLRTPEVDGMVGPRAGADVEVALAPDRVALQDVLAQIVVLQFMLAGLDDTAVPTTVHCDHLVRAREQADADLERALDDNREIYDFLRSASARYGMEFWPPGSGIIHQVMLETYAFPGGMAIGTDSHTPNAGGLGMFAVGVGGGDAIDVMTGRPFMLRWPRIIGVRLSGSLGPWCSPKDVILELAGRLSTSGATGAVIEYFGPGVATLSATGRATICNMGAELGATTSVFPFDANTERYLVATGREAVAHAASGVRDELHADPAVEVDPDPYFDEVIDIELSTLAPHVNGPDSPDAAHHAGDVGRWAAENGVPVEISAALIGSCTNSSYEDIARAASIARAAAAHGLRARIPLLVTPGSERVRATIERDGLLGDLEAIGARVLANACGPCIGQWDRTDLAAGTPNTIVNSFNRNFPRRNDGSAATKAFVTSPEMVIAYALAGTLDFDPRSDGLLTSDGGHVHLDPPVGASLPARGFAPGARPERPHDRAVTVTVSPSSERLQLLEAFAPWDGEDLVELPVLVKARGRCTTDAISPAGSWLRYRGHLERISRNLFLGAVNAYTGAMGEGRDPVDGAIRPFPDIAERLSRAGVAWCVVGDTNYGEGSSREHAAMEPRYRGARVVFARSFARIHETNLKKQGLLALTFDDPATYDAIAEGDRLSVVGLGDFGTTTAVHCVITKPHGDRVEFTCTHTMSAEQVEWFRAGSALNVIRNASPRQVDGGGTTDRLGRLPHDVGVSQRQGGEPLDEA